MPARDKLEEAKFFFDKLCVSVQQLPQDLPTQREFHYYLSAFQSASVSVIDYLLEDYNVKFGLNIPLSEKYFRAAFEREALKPGNEAALEFFNWWTKQKKLLKNDTIGKLVISKRHVGIHRRQIKPDLAKIKTGDGNVPISGSLEIKVFRGDKLEETHKVSGQPSSPLKATEPSFKWFFSDYPDEPVTTVCEKFLGKLESFVLEVEKQFP